MESIPCLLTENEEPGKETSMASKNTKQTPGENNDKNKKNLARSENPEQQAPLAASGYLPKKPESNRERFLTEENRFYEKQVPPSTAGICTIQPAKDEKLHSSPEEEARDRSRKIKNY